jgi:hypothetical protein
VDDPAASRWHASELDENRCARRSRLTTPGILRVRRDRAGWAAHADRFRGIFDSGRKDRTVAVHVRREPWSRVPGSRAARIGMPAAVMVVVFTACLGVVRRRPSPICRLAFAICAVCVLESQRMAT